MRVTVGYIPRSETALVVVKPHWYADNGYETAVFPTKAEAIEFCRKRWRVDAEHVRVSGVPEGDDE